MSFFERNKWKIILIGITVLLVVLMALSTIPSAKSNFVSDVLGVVISPVQKGISAVIGGVEGFFGSIANMRRYEDENRQLKEQVDLLESEVRETEELKKENTRLRAMLDMQERETAYDMEAAEVIAKDAGNWFLTFTIDKGTSHGIAQGDAVVTTEGLVGSVYEVGTTWAKVQSIIDSTSSAGAAIKRTGDTGVVEGDLKLQNEGLCAFVYLRRDANVTAGDYVETSGLGGIYPPGLYIGKVREVSVDAGGVSQRAVVEPAVEFDRLSEVFVMKGSALAAAQAGGGEG